MVKSQFLKSVNLRPEYSRIHSNMLLYRYFDSDLQKFILPVSACVSVLF
jgi:hypothetical protein